MQHIGRFRSRCEFTDETSAVEGAAASLKANELLFARGFALGEAMNVIELMHPRMDPGMRARVDVEAELRSRVESGVIPVDLSLSSTAAVWNGLFQQFVSERSCASCQRSCASCTKRSWMALHCPCSEPTWFDALCCLHYVQLYSQFSFLDGNTLAETVFACTYLHSPVLASVRARAGLPGACQIRHADTGVDGIVTSPDPSRDVFEARWQELKAAGIVAEPAPALELSVTGKAISPALTGSSPEGWCERPCCLAAGETAEGPTTGGAGVEAAPLGSAAQLRALVLAATVTGFGFLAGRAREAMVWADVYEDEDLNPATHGLDAMDDVSEAHALALLADAEAALAFVGAADEGGSEDPGETALESLLEAEAETLRRFAGLEPTQDDETAAEAALLGTGVVCGLPCGSGEGAVCRHLVGLVDAAGGPRALRQVHCTPPKRAKATADAASAAGADGDEERQQDAASVSAFAAADAANAAAVARLRGAPAWQHGLSPEADAGETAAAAGLRLRLRWLRALIGANFLCRRATELTPSPVPRFSGSGRRVAVGKPGEELPVDAEEAVAAAQGALLGAACGAYRCAGTTFAAIAPSLLAAAAEACTTSSAASDAGRVGEGTSGTMGAASDALGRTSVRSGALSDALLPMPAGAFDASLLDSVLGASQPRYSPMGPLPEAVSRAADLTRALGAVCCVRVFAACDPAVSQRTLARLMALGEADARASLTATEQQQRLLACTWQAHDMTKQAGLVRPLVLHAAETDTDTRGMPRISLWGLWELADSLRAAGGEACGCVVRSRLLSLLCPRNRCMRVLGVRDRRRVAEAMLLERGMSEEVLRRLQPAQVASQLAVRLSGLLRMLCSSDSRLHRVLDAAIAGWAEVQGDAWLVDSAAPSSWGGAAPPEVLAQGVYSQQAEAPAAAGAGSAASSGAGAAAGGGRAASAAAASPLRAGATSSGGAGSARGKGAALATAAGGAEAFAWAAVLAADRGAPQADERPMMIHTTMPLLLRLQMAAIDASYALDLVHPADHVPSAWYADFLARMAVLYATAAGKARFLHLRRGLLGQEAAKARAKARAVRSKGKKKPGKKGKGQTATAANGSTTADSEGAAPVPELPTGAWDKLLDARHELGRATFLLAAAAASKELLEANPGASPAGVDPESTEAMAAASRRFKERFAAVLRSHDPERLTWRKFCSSFKPAIVEAVPTLRDVAAASLRASQMLQAAKDSLLEGLGAPPLDGDALRAREEELGRAPCLLAGVRAEAAKRPSGLQRDASGKWLPRGSPEMDIISATLTDWTAWQADKVYQPVLAASNDLAAAAGKLAKAITEAELVQVSFATTVHPCIPSVVIAGVSQS